MFEQSLLPQSPAQNKRAFLASFSAQIAAVGVLVIVPLFTHQVLPVVTLVNPITFGYRPPAPQPLPETIRPRTITTRPSSLTFPTIYTSLPIIKQDIYLPPDDTTFLVSGDGFPLPTGQPNASTPAITVLHPPPPPAPKPTQQAAVQPQAPPSPIRVTSEIQAAKIIKKVVPIYPPLAKQAHIQGTVRLVGTIAKDGSMQSLTVISGHPILAQAALAAVRQWLYSPTYLNREPVEVIAPIDVTFTLQ